MPNLRAIAQETVDILSRGLYEHAVAGSVAIGRSLAEARDKTVLYTPDSFGEVFRQRESIRAAGPAHPTKFSVVNCTTLSAARKLVVEYGIQRTALLNFASAKNPGGGFLGGSRAQEESLARSSGLYACIAPQQAMYQTNRQLRSCLYTDHMIYSPGVPVIRDDSLDLLAEPYCVSMITAPAVNAGAVRRNQPQSVSQIEPTMICRIERLLSVAVVQQVEALVLGAWGCGVFKNDPSRVAAWFYRHLVANGKLAGAFRQVTFAIVDWSDEEKFIRPFHNVFGADELPAAALPG